jgi:5'-deoxynucleotidase YfbR-like HD superfamily hydrolase
MSLNEFFFTERNLDKVIRFSNQMRIKDESVAEHTFHTAFYAMILADLEISMGNKVDVEKLLRSCLVHDLEESMTGDILHGFKYSNPELLRNMKKMGEEFYRKIISNLPDSLFQKYFNMWEKAKAPGIEGEILEASDKIEALIYSIEEYSLGNRNFRPVIEYLLKSLREIKLESVKTVLKELKIPE